MTVFSRFNPSVSNLLKLIMLLAAVPPLAFALLLYKEYHGLIAFSEKELVGLEMIREYHNLPSRLEKDDSGVKAQLEDIVARTPFPLDGLGTLEASYQSLADVTAAIADASNLTLDPDLDTFYLMDTNTVQIPNFMRASHDIATFLEKAETGLPSGSDMEKVVIDMATLKLVLQKLDSNLIKARKFTADPVMLVTAQQTLVQLTEISHRYHDQARMLLQEIRKGETISASGIRELHNQIISITERYWEQSLRANHQLIEVRVDGKYVRMYESFSAGFFVMVLVLLGTFAAHRKILTVLGDFSQVFQMRIRRISESGRTMHHVVQTMVAASEQTSRQSQIVKANTHDATEQVAVVSSSVQDFNVSIRDISRSVTETGQHVEMVVSKASHTSEVIHQLKDATTQISSVVSLINDLAGQTNLLALNAAIEAARAGEAGRGFAVVADEVKKLASNTSTATIDIGQQVTSMQGVAETAVEVLNELVVLIRSIQSNSSTVAAAIEEQTTVSANISTASETATQCVKAVETNMAGIEQAANDTSQTASDVEGSTQQMEDIVRELDEAMQETLRKMGVSEKTRPKAVDWAASRLRRDTATSRSLGDFALATA